MSNHAVSVFRLPTTLARFCLALTIEHPGPTIRDLEAEIIVCVHKLLPWFKSACHALQDECFSYGAAPSLASLLQHCRVARNLCG